MILTRFRMKIEKLGIESKVFFPPLIIVLLLSYFIFSDIYTANIIINKIFKYITNTWGWAFIWYMVVFSIIWLWMFLGPLKDKRLGEEEPEFSTVSWVFLMFTSCISSAVIFWLSIEAYFYISNPPFANAAFSMEAKEFALAYSLFHWGPIPWATYAVLTVAFGYFIWVKKINVMRPSICIEGAVGEKLSKGWLGTLIDNLYIIGLILAMGVSLDFSTLLVTQCITYLFGTEGSLKLNIMIITIWIFFNIICVAFGLKKGIKLASNLRSYLSIIIFAWVFIIGVSSFTINYFTDSVGVLINNFGRMLFYTDSIRAEGFPQSWTVFYWAWWIVYGIQMCIFLARISRGRTVKEICLYMVAGLTIITWLMGAILGSNTMYVMQNELINMAEIIKEHGAARAIVETWATLPFSTLTIWGFFILCFLATVTMVNASSYTLAMSTCKESSGYCEPPLWIRISWSIMVGIIGVALLSLCDLKPIQTATIVGGCPLFIVNILILYSFFKDTKKSKWY